MSQVLMSTFVAKAAKVADYDHWQGGMPTCGDSICQSCNRPLLSIWDLNCDDPRFIADDKPIFDGIQRLPLLMCWRCSGSLAYIVQNGAVRTLECTGEFQGDDFPYSDYPESYPKRALKLTHRDDIPNEVHELLAEMDDPFQKFSERQQQLLHELLDREVKSGFDLWWHQVGGEPGLLQGLDDQPCPNASCKRRLRGEPLKVLAAIKNDPPGGLPMLESLEQVQKNNGHFNSWVQLVYYICDECFAIRMVQDLD